jgi:hypothetical protein
VVDTRVDIGVDTYVVTADVAVLAKSTGLWPADAPAPPVLGVAELSST